MQITLAKSEDLPLLRAFAERTFREAFEMDNDPVRFDAYCQAAFSSAQFQKELLDPAAQFWLAWEGVELAAYLKLNFADHAPQLKSQRTVKVERLYVDSGFQNRGIGALLLDFAAEQAQIQAASHLWLSVWQARPRSIRFYERCGFAIFTEEVFWLADEAQMDWLMSKKA